MTSNGPRSRTMPSQSNPIKKNEVCYTMPYVARTTPNRSMTTNRDAIERWMESTFNNPWWSSFWNNGDQAASGAITFPVDIYENPDSYVVLAAIPGVNPDDVQITALNGMLT